MNDPQSLVDLLVEQAQRLYAGAASIFPNVLGALGLLLVGLLAAWVLRFLAVRAVRFGINRIQRLRSPSEQGSVERFSNVPRLVGRLVFWFVLLFSIAPSIQVLGIGAVSTILEDFTTFLPQILAAALVVLVSLFFGDLARSGVTRAAARMGVGHPQLAGRLVQFFIWGVAAMIAVNQLGIASTALLILLAIVFGSAFGAAALAFGLGARTAVGNIIASHYVLKSMRVGHRIRIDGAEGKIAQITRTHVYLKTDEGTMLIPASRFSEQTATVIQGDR